MSNNKSQKDSQASTLAALLKDKPKRGRPPRVVSRQNVYVALSKEQKEQMSELAMYLPSELVRADLPDLAISILSARFEALRRAVADREQEIPEGITDLESLYLLWDLPLPGEEKESKWTSIRVSPQQAIELGRVHGTFNAVFGATRSQTFRLGLVLLTHFLKNEAHYNASTLTTLSDVRKKIQDIYL